MHIELQRVLKTYGKTRALDAADLNVPPSSIVAVLGENGAGKSTLLRLLAGVSAPEGGSVRLDGHVLHRERLDLRARMLFTPDTPLLFAEQTVARNIAMYRGIYKIPLDRDEERLREWLRLTGVAEMMEKRVHTLSRGQVWKTALACVAAVMPELWLVDEPFASGMDALGLSAFRRLARHLVEMGGSVIYTTQMVELAAGLADHICVLKQGEVVLWEPVAKVKELLAAGEDGPAQVLRGLKERGPDPVHP